MSVSTIVIVPKYAQQAENLRNTLYFSSHPQDLPTLQWHFNLKYSHSKYVATWLVRIWDLIREMTGCVDL